uniref:Uncharacterized protein n=1 Tax=Anguilla anguilla TaxID=7936 RepID=A0A0E9P5X4_ANGAN
MQKTFTWWQKYTALRTTAEKMYLKLICNFSYHCCYTCLNKCLSLYSEHCVQS